MISSSFQGGYKPIYLDSKVWKVVADTSPIMGTGQYKTIFTSGEVDTSRLSSAQIQPSYPVTNAKHSFSHLFVMKDDIITDLVAPTANHYGLDYNSLSNLLTSGVIPQNRSVRTGATAGHRPFLCW